MGLVSFGSVIITMRSIDVLLMLFWVFMMGRDWFWKNSALRRMNDLQKRLKTLEDINRRNEQSDYMWSAKDRCSWHAPAESNS